MKVLVDMNLSPDWAEFLTAAGFQAVHWSNVGPGDAPDDELMQWAANHDHVVLTLTWTLQLFWRRPDVGNPVSFRFGARILVRRLSERQ